MKVIIGLALIGLSVGVFRWLDRLADWERGWVAKHRDWMFGPRPGPVPARDRPLDPLIETFRTGGRWLYPESPRYFRLKWVFMGLLVGVIGVALLIG